MAFPNFDIGQVFRDFVTHGVPSSGKWAPRKAEIRRTLKEHESAIIALIGGQGGDIDLARGVVYFAVTGGDANAITAEPDAALPANPGSAVFILGGIEQTNTGDVTVNGKPLLTNSGNQVPAGGLIADGIYLFLDAGSSYRLLSDYASASIVAEAEAAVSDANAAAVRAETFAAMQSADKVKFTSVPALLADDVMSYGPGTGLIEVGPGDVIEAGGFRYSVAASGAADHHVTTAGGVKLYVLPLGDRMYASAFGIAGDGSDQTALLQKLFTAAAGYEIRLGRAQTYLSTEGIQLPEGTELNLRGSTINFNCPDIRDRCLEIYGNDVTVKNGAVRNISGVVGYEGSMQTPITIGRFQELIGFSGIVIEDMSVETMSLMGNGIVICGASHNIEIRRIRFPDSAYVGIPVMAHWSFNAAVVNIGGQRVTSHQKNIRINNIWCGTLSRLGDVGNCAVVMLSSVYSAEVSNITCENFSRGRAIYVYCGDWGFQFAQDANEQFLGSRGISIKNIYGRFFHGLEVYMRNTHGEPLIIWPLSVTFDHIHAHGYGISSSSSWGFRVSGPNVGIQNSSFDGFYDGGLPSTGSTNFRFMDNEVKNSRRYGILANENIEDAASWQIRGNTFSDNNQGGFANVADIFLARAVGADVMDNTFDSPMCTNNVRTVGAANRPRFIKVSGNHTKRNSTGPNYIFGSSADVDIASRFESNTYETAPAIFKGGQQVIGARNNISTAPLYIGEQAVIPGGNAYIATGTTSTADWKQITN